MKFPRRSALAFACLGSMAIDAAGYAAPRDDPYPPVLADPVRPPEDVARDQLARLKVFKQKRDSKAVERQLLTIRNAAAGQDKGEFRQGRNGDHRRPGRHLCTGGLVAHPCRQLAKPAVALSDKQKVSPVPRRALAELTVATAR